MILRDFKWIKRLIAFSSDVFVTSFSWFGATWLTTTIILQASVSTITIATITIIQSLICILCGLYRGVWRFASIPDLIRILRAVLIGTTLSIVLLELNDIHLPIKAYIIYALILLLMLSGSRLIFRWLRDYRIYFSQGKRILIVGAGNAGEGIIRDLYRSRSVYKYSPIGIVDDNVARHGCEVQGVRVLGACKDIPKLVTKYNIELILIAIPSADSKRMREIVKYCEKSKILFRTLPSLRDIADGSVTITSLREVLLDDLLGREQVDLEWNEIKDSIMNKSILITGGGGSIGSELCRQIAKLSPSSLIIIDNNEYRLYSIDMELRNKNEKLTIYSSLCNITDKSDIERIFSLHKPDLVFHVAAYKHVPLLETHTRASVYNNIIGTKTVAELSEKYGVKSFVLISTDKAVNPSSMMGATKRVSEIFCQTFNLHSSTRFITVRFGNVLDSAGSVVPLFRSQLLKGGPITVTHRDITRYFMTIPEASQLILQANTMKNHGDIFVLDMGEPINIRYLAEQMIKLSGKIVGQDIDIVYTGLRPGEKLYEELFHENENICETSHPKIRQAKVREYHWATLLKIMNEIEDACYRCDETQLKELLYLLVPEYQMSSNIVNMPAADIKKTYTNYFLSPHGKTVPAN
jgi:FlaA1/EpsC-like NDP-sugar epimerase